MKTGLISKAYKSLGAAFVIVLIFGAGSFWTDHCDNTEFRKVEGLKMHDAIITLSPLPAQVDGMQGDINAILVEFGISKGVGTNGVCYTSTGESLFIYSQNQSLSRSLEETKIKTAYVDQTDAGKNL